MADSEDQPVLLTEGNFVQEDAEKDSSDQVVDSTNETTEQDGGASGDIDLVEDPAATSPVPGPGTLVAEDLRPSTAPEPGLSSGSLQEVERSITKAVSDTLMPGSVNDGEEEGDGFNEALQPDTLSDRLDQLPYDLGDDVEYMAPPEDPYMRAVNYMEKYKVMQIFQVVKPCAMSLSVSQQKL